MLASSSPMNTYNFKVQSPISGVSLELISVVAGSYALPEFGAFSPELHSYSSVSSGNGTVNNNGNYTNFVVLYSLRLSGVAPAFPPTEELRLKVFIPSPNIGGIVSQSFIPGSRYNISPLFTSVEIVRQSTGLPPAGFPNVAGVGQLQARLLSTSGEIALVVTNYALGPPAVTTPLTVGDLLPLFGVNDTLVIRVNGNYSSV